MKDVPVESLIKEEIRTKILNSYGTVENPTMPTDKELEVMVDTKYRKIVHQLVDYYWEH